MARDVAALAFYTFYMRKQCDALFDTAPLGTGQRHTMATARATRAPPRGARRATTARWIATRSRATRATRGTRGRARATPNDGEAHAAYLRDVAATRAPAELAALARVLDALGCETIAPNARRGIHPLVMPLARTREGGVIGLMVTRGRRGGDAGGRGAGRRARDDAGEEREGLRAQSDRRGGSDER